MKKLPIKLDDSIRMQRMQSLYESEININVGWFWDGGVECTVGESEFNDPKEQVTFYPENYETKGDLIRAAFDWVWFAAKKHYPNAECFKLNGVEKAIERLEGNDERILDEISSS